MSREEDGPGGLPANRIEALADGIFAVAMTLLVLELKVPEPDHAEPGALAHALGALAPKILAYAVGFVILGTFWVGHHYQFHYIRRTDRVLLWINIAFLLVVSFLPFAVALLGSYASESAPAILYGAVLLAAGSCLLAQWTYATRGRRLVASDLDESVVRALRGRVLFGMLGYGAGLAAAFVAPRASLAIYAVMPLAYVLPGRIDRLTHRKGVTS